MHPSKRPWDDLGSNPKKLKLEDSSKRIDERNVTKVEYGSLLRRDINEASGKQKFKMVIIDNCPTLQEAIFAEISDCIKSLAESDTFIVVLSISEPMPANDAELLQQISEKVYAKQMILQLSYGEECSIFYKECNEGLKKLELQKENIIEERHLVNEINFEILCHLLHFRPNNGKFNFNLIATEVAMEKSIQTFA